MDYVIDPEIQSLLTPLTKEEYDGLESQILDGLHVDPCVIAILDGKRVLGDGHNRQTICLKHGIEIPTRTKKFSSRESLIAWVINNQFSRRNLTDERKSYYRGKEYLNLKKNPGNPQLGQNVLIGNQEGATAEKLAEKHGVTGKTIQRDAAFAEAVDDLEKGEKEIVLNGQSGQTKKAIAGGKKPILCKRCQRTGAVKDCTGCEDARKEAKKPKTLKEQVDDSLAEPEEETPDPTMDEIMKSKNGEIESYARKLSAMIDEIPDDPWLDADNHKGGITQKIKDACGAIRACKCQHVCPMCQGDGCSKCHKTGRVTHYAYQQLAG